MPRPVQRGAEALALSKHYNLKGKLPLQLDETIVPVHVVGALDSDATAVRYAGINGRAAAGVGVASLVGIRNPEGSGVLATITGVSVNTAAGLVTPRMWIHYSPDILAVADVGAGYRCQPDGAFFSSCRLITSTATPPPPLDGLIGQFNIQAGENQNNLADLVPVVLGPGSQLWLEQQGTNTAINANWSWYEAPVEPSGL